MNSKSNPKKNHAPKGRLPGGEIRQKLVEWAKHRDKVKAEHLILGAVKRGTPYRALSLASMAEIVLGHGTIKLKNFSKELAEAQEADDWRFILALAEWYKNRKPFYRDRLMLFMAERLSISKPQSDSEMLAMAKAEGIKLVTLNGVRDRRLDLMRIALGKPRRSKVRKVQPTKQAVAT